MAPVPVTMVQCHDQQPAACWRILSHPKTMWKTPQTAVYDALHFQITTIFIGLWRHWRNAVRRRAFTSSRRGSVWPTLTPDGGWGPGCTNSQVTCSSTSSVQLLRYLTKSSALTCSDHGGGGGLDIFDQTSNLSQFWPVNSINRNIHYLKKDFIYVSKIYPSIY